MPATKTQTPAAALSFLADVAAIATTCTLSTVAAATITNRHGRRTTVTSTDHTGLIALRITFAWAYATHTWTVRVVNVATSTAFDSTVAEATAALHAADSNYYRELARAA